MNILPAKLLNLLDIKPSDLKPSSLTIKAYDSTARSVLGSITMNLWFGKKSMPVEFQVIDIPITFNALLGRPWLHQAGGVASSLHQCVKFMVDGNVTTIYGDLITSNGSDTGGIPILEIKHDDDGYMLTGFSVETPKVQVCAVDLTTTRDKITPAMKMMRNMNYLPGLGLGKRLQGTHKIIDVKEHASRHGLGYKPTARDDAKNKEVARKRKEAILKKVPYGGPNPTPFSHDLTDYFVKGGIQTEEATNPTPMDEWMKLQEKLSKCRGIKANPINRAFLDLPEMPGAITTIKNSYSFRGMPGITEQFEKLNMDIPVIGKPTEVEFQLVQPKDKTVEDPSDQWDEAVLQQMFGEDVPEPNLIDLGPMDAVIAMIETGNEEAAQAES